MSPGTTIGVRAAARWLGVHENTIRRWAKAGRLPVASRLNERGYIRFREADVKALYEEMTR